MTPALSQVHHGSNHLGIAVVLVTAVVVVGLFITYALRPPRR